MRQVRCRPPRRLRYRPASLLVLRDPRVHRDHKVNRVKLVLLVPLALLGWMVLGVLTASTVGKVIKDHLDPSDPSDPEDLPERQDLWEFRDWMERPDLTAYLGPLDHQALSDPQARHPQN